MDQWRRLLSFSHPQCADALGPMDLVGRHRDEVRTLAEFQPAERLHGIAQHQGAGLMRHVRDLRNRLSDADLVVDHHHRDQQHAVVELASEQIEVEAAVVLDWKNGEVDALAREPFAAVENRGMFGGYVDDTVPSVLAFGTRFFDGPFERPVDRFGPAARESHAAALEADRFFYLLARDFDRGLRFAAPARWRMGVGEFLLDTRLHRLCDFGRDRRRGLVIEADQAALAAVCSAMLCHSTRKRSTSASLVSGPKLIRTKLPAMSGATSIAARTRLCFIAPADQALPDDTAIPARSSCTSKNALAVS